ncbi:hypothetical protein BGZ75_000229 [Mortierella antarctica]|nr:hypothetical protein BGZ75_000229 [Mortierella antarctica]
MSVDDPVPALENTPLMSSPVDDADYCALASAASKAGHGVIPYSLAKGCYEMFPFDSRIRDSTLRSVHANLESFYVFYDIAKSPPPLENSDLSPVDLSLSLMTLGNMTFPTDYAFHSDLAQLIAQLQDPHTTYKSMCYQQFQFIQPLSTYGVYENERQQVKIATVLNELDPRLGKALVDCEVTHIDGSPAFEVVSEFARTKSYSKDHGVRLNKAFSYLAHDRTGSAYDRYALGTFAQRSTIPPNATVEYKISCESKMIKAGSATNPSAPAETTIELAWSALDATMAPYSNARSYRKQFCADDSIQTVKKFVLDSASPDDFSPAKAHLHGGHAKSRELFRGPYASFHMLSDGNTAIFRLGTESPDKMDTSRNTFYSNIDDGFAAMAAAGATKLIIDLQNNSGGIICWGRYVLQTLFPHTIDAPYIYNLRASPLAQALARATFANNDQDIESPYMGLVDPDTGDELNDDSWMIPGRTLPGREGYFSDQVTDRYCAAVEDIKGSSDDTPFKAENMIILTNGFCGSTCAVLALQLHERYGVRSVAIGGHHGESMAFTSFPGGAVQANNSMWVSRIQQVFDMLPESAHTRKLRELLPRQLPANGQLTFTFRQVMSAAFPDKVSEYMRVPSEFRMDYTSARFRMPSILWEDVRNEVWGDSALDNAAEDDEREDGEGGENGERGEEEEEEDDDDHSWEGYGEETHRGQGGLGVEADDTLGGIGLVAVVDDETPDEELDRAAAEADREDLEWLERYDIDIAK